MNNEYIQHIIWQLKETYNGHPWHGRSIKSLLEDVTPQMALKKPNENSHSIAELVYHMVTWRDFTITRLESEEGKDSAYFDKMDWRELDLSSAKTWEEGLRLMEESQNRLISVLGKFNDSILPEKVAERKYDFKLLLDGLVQHEAYHAGQIAYAMKLLA